MTTFEIIVAIVGMALITLLTRGLFVMLPRDVPLPAWFRQGLRYAPLGALAAIVVPELVMKDGALITTWLDARLFAATVGGAYFYFRRGMLGTIVVGLAVYLLLHLGLGW